MKTNERKLYGASAVLLALPFLGVVVVQLLTPPPFSADLYHEVVDLGPRVRPNLEQVEVVIPGRPHPLPYRPGDPGYARRIGRRLGYRCSTNAYGHRGGPVRGRPLPGTTRIICFGDSVTFGHGVDQGQDYPARLQQELDRHGKFEVINAGNPRESSLFAARALERLIIPLQPRLVILGLGLNDLTAPFQPGDNVTTYYPAEYQNIGRLVAFSLRRMIKLLRRKKIKVALIVPALNSFYPLPEHRFAMEVIRSLGPELDVPVFDMQQAFRSQQQTTGLVLKLSGRLYRHQELVKYQAGNARSLLLVQTEAVRPQHISDEIYSYLDRHHEAHALSIDGALPNPAGHRLMARILARGILKMVDPGGGARR